MILLYRPKDLREIIHREQSEPSLLCQLKAHWKHWPFWLLKQNVHLLLLASYKIWLSETFYNSLKIISNWRIAFFLTHWRRSNTNGKIAAKVGVTVTTQHVFSYFTINKAFTCKLWRKKNLTTIESLKLMKWFSILKVNFPALIQCRK